LKQKAARQELVGTKATITDGSQSCLYQGEES